MEILTSVVFTIQGLPVLCAAFFPALLVIPFSSFCFSHPLAGCSPSLSFPLLLIPTRWVGFLMCSPSRLSFGMRSGAPAVTHPDTGWVSSRASSGMAAHVTDGLHETAFSHPLGQRRILARDQWKPKQVFGFGQVHIEGNVQPGIFRSTWEAATDSWPHPGNRIQRGKLAASQNG